MALLPEVPPFKAIVVPQRQGSHSVRRIVRVNIVTLDDENSAKRRFLENWKPLLELSEADLNTIAVHGQTSGMFQSPVVHLIADGPSDPWCCTYRDFSRGIAEVVWVEASPPIKPIRPLNALVFVPDLQDLCFAHSYVTAANASSLRLDYGFLSVLAGRKRTIEILGLGVDNESDEG